MKLIDTHCHLYLEEFDEDRDILVQKALSSGIEKILLPNVDLSTIEQMHSLCEQYPTFAYPMMGLHPTSIDNKYASTLATIEAHLSKHAYCAIGEIGIDLYWDKTFLKEQIIAFEEQLKWSIDLNLPVAIHTRDAFPEVLESIHKIGPEKLYGIFHSFGGSLDDLNAIKKLSNFKLGINGVVTFKNSNLPEVLRQTTIQHLVLETDAPYLSPVPFRGKRNEPTHIWETAKKIAETYNLSLEETVNITSKNATETFKHIQSDA